MPFYALLQSVDLDFGVYENRFTQYFFTYLTLLHLSSQSVSRPNALFSSCLYEAPPSEKLNVL